MSYDSALILRAFKDILQMYTFWLDSEKELGYAVPADFVYSLNDVHIHPEGFTEIEARLVCHILQFSLGKYCKISLRLEENFDDGERECAIVIKRSLRC